MIEKGSQANAQPGPIRIALSLLFLLILVVAVVWGIFALISALAPAVSGSISGFLGLPPTVSAAIIAGIVALLVSPLSTYLAKWWERKLYIEQEQRKQMIETYEGFMQFWFGVLASSRPGMTPPSPEELSEFFTAYTPKLIT